MNRCQCKREFMCVGVCARQCVNAWKPESVERALAYRLAGSYINNSGTNIQRTMVTVSILRYPYTFRPDPEYPGSARNHLCPPYSGSNCRLVNRDGFVARSVVFGNVRVSAGQVGSVRCLNISLAKELWSNKAIFDNFSLCLFKRCRWHVDNFALEICLTATPYYCFLSYPF